MKNSSLAALATGVGCLYLFLHPNPVAAVITAIFVATHIIAKAIEDGVADLGKSWIDIDLLREAIKEYFDSAGTQENDDEQNQAPQASKG